MITHPGPTFLAHEMTAKPTRRTTASNCGSMGRLAVTMGTRHNEMEAYDALPKSIRMMIGQASAMVSCADVLDMIAKRGVKYVEMDFPHFCQHLDYEYRMQMAEALRK